MYTFSTSNSFLAAEKIFALFNNQGVPSSGRDGDLYVVGSGLSGEGVRLLGQKLANMTIGDIESMMDLKDIDPFKVAELAEDLKDLAKALVSVYVDPLIY